MRLECPLGDGVAALNPVERFATGMADGENPKHLLPENIRYVIMKDAKINAAKITCAESI